MGPNKEIMDSTGNLIKIGDTVRFRGQHYTISGFSGLPNDIGVLEIYFSEENVHTSEVATEINVDLVR